MLSLEGSIENVVFSALLSLPPQCGPYHEGHRCPGAAQHGPSSSNDSNLTESRVQTFIPEPRDPQLPGCLSAAKIRDTS